MLHWVREQLLASGLDESYAFKAEIASEEALVNIIEHAYKKKEGTIEIDIHEEDGERRFVAITIRDHGPPFNPLQQNIAINRLAPIEEREVGGLGILFMREYMDEVLYRREKNSNILILIKNKP